MKNNLGLMKGLDLYFSGLTDKEYEQAAQKVNMQDISLLPLMSWDFHIEALDKGFEDGKKQADLDTLLNFKDKYKWQNDLQSIINQNPYEALVLTDANQNILWVNVGFKHMTGYSKKEAVNQTPTFLQGPQTSAKSKARIKENLRSNTPFTSEILNYKKDKTPYNCEVKIFPLYNAKNRCFLALEREV